jgi:geranyl-CoA carboxylase alpha subunit
MPAYQPFRALLIANRGEIARRIIHTARRIGIATIAVYSAADRDALHVRDADRAHPIGGPTPGESYLNIAATLDAARITDAEAVHPGYGFLAENAEFAQAVIDAGLVWIGPPPAAIRAMGDKGAAKRLARELDVPVLPGYEGPNQSDTACAEAARNIGFPVLVKAAAGGGGRGMRLARSMGELGAALAAARSEALNAFGDERVILERAVEGARHVEVQIFADRQGDCIHLGERDCSVQRRHQKLIEESPSPIVSPRMRALMGESAVALARAVGYVGAGTIEFLVDTDERYYFMEMNTRLQVEHPVTEMVTGLDLVEWQLRVAAGESLPLAQADVQLAGHAIEVRLCAEDPARDFLPQTGTLSVWSTRADAVAFTVNDASGRAPLRVDAAIESGSSIEPFYDSMIAKVIGYGRNRDEAREGLANALESTIALGVATNKALLTAVLRDSAFATRGVAIDFLARERERLLMRSPASDTVAIAAALFVDEAARQAQFGEWSAWSNNPARPVVLRLACAGSTHDVSLRCAAGRQYSVHVGEHERVLSIVSSDGQRAVASLDAPPTTRVTLAFRLEGRVLHLALDASSWTFENVLHAQAARRDTAQSDGRLLAPMNARVVAVHARTGESVARGAPLVVLEAMKMEHVLTASSAARVKSVLVAPGAQVQPGQLLVELEPVRP